MRVCVCVCARARPRMPVSICGMYVCAFVCIITTSDFGYMYVCMYHIPSLCVYIHASTHVFIWVRQRPEIPKAYTYSHTYIHSYIHTPTHVFRYVKVRPKIQKAYCIHSYPHTHMFADMSKSAVRSQNHIYAYIHMHSYPHTHTHTCLQVCLRAP
jgi:hypothetical protein